MSIKTLANVAIKTMKREAPAISTGIAIASTIAAVGLGVRAGMEAQKIMDHEVRIRKALANEETKPYVAPTKKETVAMTWKVYILPTIATLSAIGATVMLHRVGLNRTASAMALYSVSEKAFSDYRKGVVEKLGEDAHKSVRESVAHDAITSNPPSKNIVISGSDILCYDSYSGHYFKSSAQEIDKAVNNLNLQIIHNMYASLTDFYDMIGIQSSEMSETVGWMPDCLLEVEYSSGIAPDGQPYLAVDFRNPPIVDFDRFSN